jgi:hypothetical protein
MPKGTIKYITIEDRVVFKNGLQRKLLELARDKTPHLSWKEFANNVLNVTGRMMFCYLNESSRLSLKQVEKLANFVDIPFNKLIDEWIVKIIKKNEALKEYGKRGGKIGAANVLRKYGRLGWHIDGDVPRNLLTRHFTEVDIGKARENGKKGWERLVEKYGIESVKRMMSKNARKYNLKRSLLNQKPQPQERELVRENIINNLKFEFNMILGKGIDWRCFDFVYFSDDKLILVEEVTSVNYIHKGQFLDFVEKKNWLMKKFNVPLIVTFEKKLQRPDLFLLLIDEGIIPVFNRKLRLKLIRSLVLNQNNVVKNYISKLKKAFQLEVNLKKNHLKASAKREYNRLDEYEELVHKKLTKLGLYPKGKKILQTIHKTFLIPDDYFEYGGKSFCVLTSHANSFNSMRVLASEHAAYSFFIKRLVDPEMKCISIFFYDDEGGFNFIKDSNSLYRDYLRKHVDIILNFKEIDNLPNLLN